MSEKKTIVFNESLFNGNTKSNKNKTKKKKIKPSSSLIKPNTLKKNLLQKIKQHQINQKIKNNEINNDSSNMKNITPTHDNFQNSFSESMEYLDKLNAKFKQKKLLKKQKKIQNKNNAITNSTSNHTNAISSNLNKTLKNPYNVSFNTPHIKIEPMVQVDIPIHSQLSSNLNNKIINDLNQNNTNSSTNNSLSISSNFKPTIPIESSNTIKENKSQDVPYGCLKGGSKPTYRTYHNKTLKNRSFIKNNKDKITINNSNKLKPKSYKKLKQKIRKTIKTKYKLGKNNNNRVSVLIKNNKTRKNIKREQGILKQKPISEIKQYLYNKNLLKIGSTAPPDILRTLYEQSILAGDITNISSDITLYNFVNGKN